MKNIRNDIEKVQYTTYEYDNEKEKLEHMDKMKSKGFEILENFQNKDHVVYRKFFDN